MSAREPQEVAEVAVGVGTKKVHRRWDKVLVSAFLGGAYIAFGGLVAITVSSGLAPDIWGTLPTLGGFNWSSQHLELEVLDGSPSAGSRSCAAAKDEVSGSVGLSTACGGCFLAPDRGREAHRGCGRAVGVSDVIGVRWFRQGGGMPPQELDQGSSGRYSVFLRA